MGFDDDGWLAVQRELFGLCLELSGFASENLAMLARSGVAPQAASVLSGMVIMCDWITSNTRAFPLFLLDSGDYEFASEDDEFEDAAMLSCGNNELNLETFRSRARRGWDLIELLPSWKSTLLPVDASSSLYERRFDFPPGSSPRPIQQEALSLARRIEEPGLMIIEAPMGEGKTEAALAAAEVLAARTGAGGVCVALPTMATTDAMFSRVHKWIEHLPRMGAEGAGSVYLAHGKSRLNEEYQGIIRETRYRGGDMDHDGEFSALAEVSDWMLGSKKGMLANFVVCTIDQVLMGVLQMKHLALRHLSLVGKVVVIDECHAYDMYMRQYLDVVLEWFGGWRVPVVLLSATLPKALREEMTNSCLRGWGAGDSFTSATGMDFCYPLITYTVGSKVMQESVAASRRSADVRVQLISDDVQALVDLLKEKLGKGGCAGVICDTVGRAQEAAGALRAVFGAQSVTLTHARFTDVDRMRNELDLRTMLGPDATVENGKRPDFHVVVGTQVLEQSLDIDFDLLVTDLAPVDLLFQRLGRCHRHARSYRPAGLEEACCFVRGVSAWKQGIPEFSKGLTSVYERANLMETMGVCGLTEASAAVYLALPADVSKKVQLAYGQDADSSIPAEWTDSYRAACEQRRSNCEEKQRRAKHCLLKSSRKMAEDQESLTDWYSVASAKNANEDYGPRAVRDSQETVEVILLHQKGNGVHLLPWVGAPDKGVEFGAKIPTDEVPDSGIAKLAVQSSVRLPPSLCRQEYVEELIAVLEKVGAPFVGAWQESPWLQRRLVLPLRDDGGAMSMKIDSNDYKEWILSYTRDEGLTVNAGEKDA